MAIEPVTYTPAPIPAFEDSISTHYERELERLRTSLDSIIAAIRELQAAQP